MVLINQNINKAITMLENLLSKSMDNEQIVCIHGNENGKTLRYSTKLEEFFIDINEIYLTAGWFELDIRKEITNIVFSEDGNSVHIIFVDEELYIDL